MVSINPKSSDNHQMISLDRGSYMQFIFAGLSLFVLLIIITIIIIIIKYGSKSHMNKKKNSCGDIDKTGLALNCGQFSSNITRMKISHSFADNSDSDSSEDVLYDVNRGLGANNYVVDRVQPKQCPLRQQSVSSIESDIESVASIVLSVINDGNKSVITLIKAKNLKRSGTASSDKLIPEGVFARIYPKSIASSPESEDNRSEEFYESSFVKSKKSKIIKFKSNETFSIDNKQFPIRVSVYEFDKHKTRFSIGHSFLGLNTRDNYLTNQIIELDLFATIYGALNAKYAFK